MRILGWLIAALVFGALGVYSIVATCIGLTCFIIMVYEISCEEKVKAEIRHEKRFKVWVNGMVVNSNLTEEEADVMADTYLKAGFFDVETGEK